MMWLPPSASRGACTECAVPRPLSGCRADRVAPNLVRESVAIGIPLRPTATLPPGLDARRPLNSPGVTGGRQAGTCSAALCYSQVCPTAHRRLGPEVRASGAVAPMVCSFSGKPIPTDKLFVLYYPPAAAHEKWNKSFLAAARAREALSTTCEHLQCFFLRYVVTSKIVPGALAASAGLALLAAWVLPALSGWSEMGFASRYLLPLPGLALILFGKGRLGAFLERWRIWRQGCRHQVATEYAAIREIMDGLPDDPDAEEAAVVMRRECPDALSAIAFQGNNFKAFTYMDFVLSPKLRHPGHRAELPPMHSLFRDAYYVGEVVYDNWRMFHKDRRTVADPRFVGSEGRRGVI